MRLSRELSRRILLVDKPEELDSCICEIEKELGGVRYLPVGNRSNNEGIVRISTDPSIALIERITNSTDAVIELEAQKREAAGEAITVQSPQEAARMWFGVSENIGDTPKERRLDIASKIVASLHDSGQPDKPTVSVRDHGIGQNPRMFPDTFLSLLASNKKHKPYLHGMFNMGSNASYNFAQGTILVSRRSPELGDHADGVGFTVVKVDLDREPGPCVYLTAPDGSIIELDLDEGEFAPGTLVKLLAYELKEYGSRVNCADTSLRHLLNSRIPMPALPMRVRDFRPEHTAGRGESENSDTVLGLLHILSRERETDEGTESTCVVKARSTIDLGDLGKLDLRYFVLDEKTKQSKYVKAHQGLTLTLKGQSQATRERLWFKEVGYNNIFNRIIAFCECSELSLRGLRELFTSGREHAVKGPTLDIVVEAIKQVLQDDERLQALEDEAKQKAIESSAYKTSQAAVERLKRRIGSFRSKKKDGKKVGPRCPPSGRKRPIDDSHLPEVPTEIFFEKKPIKLSPGKRTIYLRINTKNGYIPHYEEKKRNLMVSIPEKCGTVDGTSMLMGGFVRVLVTINPEAVGEEHPIDAALIDFTGETALILRCNSTIVVNKAAADDRTEDKGGGDKDHDHEVKIVPVWYDRTQWEIHDADHKTVGHCVVKKWEILIYLNRDYGPLYEMLERIKRSGRVTERTINSIMEKYFVAVGEGLFRLEKDEVDPEEIGAIAALALLDPEIDDEDCEPKRKPKPRSKMPLVREEPPAGRLSGCGTFIKETEMAEKSRNSRD
jgi:hypothetical protein